MSNNAHVSGNGDASNLGRSEGTFLFLFLGGARLKIVSGLNPREIDFCRGFRRSREVGGWKCSQVLNYVERAVGQPLDIRLDTTPKPSAIRHSWQPTTSSCLPSAPP